MDASFTKRAKIKTLLKVPKHPTGVYQLRTGNVHCSVSQALLLCTPNASRTGVMGASAQRAARDHPFTSGGSEATTHTGHCLVAHSLHNPRSLPTPLFIRSTDMYGVLQIC